MYTLVRRTMAKLYWRIKKNGKWTWQPAEYIDEIDQLGVYTVLPGEEE